MNARWYQEFINKRLVVHSTSFRPLRAKPILFHRLSWRSRTSWPIHRRTWLKQRKLTRMYVTVIQPIIKLPTTQSPWENHMILVVSWGDMHGTYRWSQYQTLLQWGSATSISQMQWRTHWLWDMMMDMKIVPSLIPGVYITFSVTCNT